MTVTATIEKAVKGARASKSRPAATEQWNVTVETKSDGGKILSRLSSSVVGKQDDAVEHAQYLAGDDSLEVEVVE